MTVFSQTNTAHTQNIKAFPHHPVPPTTASTSVQLLHSITSGIAHDPTVILQLEGTSLHSVIFEVEVVEGLKVVHTVDQRVGSVEASMDVAGHGETTSLGSILGSCSMKIKE